MLAHARRFAALSQLHHASVDTRSALSSSSQRLFTSLPVANERPRPSTAPLAMSSSPRLVGPLVMRLHKPFPLVGSPIVLLQVRNFSRRSGRTPWETSGQGDWMSIVKTGALLAVGAGAVVAAASVGFGFIVFGAAGYGIYSLYRRFFVPYRSNDPFGAVQADIDRIFKRDHSSKPRSAAQPANGDRDVDALVEGLPFVVRGLVKTLFSFVGGAMKSSMARAGELRRLVNESMRANANIVSQMGSDVSISTPQNWMETTVNGLGRVEAVFPVNGDGYGQAHVTAKASIGANGELSLQELKYRNLRTGEVIDLMRGGPATGSRRKTIVDADYVDLDDRK